MYHQSTIILNVIKKMPMPFQLPQILRHSNHYSPDYHQKAIFLKKTPMGALARKLSALSSIVSAFLMATIAPKIASATNAVIMNSSSLSLVAQ
jgi:hypothetical protein